MKTIKETIEELTPTAVARAMGLPISTIFRWMNENRIPGKGAAHDWRAREFETAVARLRAEAAKTTQPKEPPARRSRARGAYPRRAAA